jgi:YegS/Rv2252/BmrU family lipid kinase
MAWGGDGTINEVASALAFGDVPLAIIPAGSGNGLARELKVDRRPERAIVDAMRANPQPMDLGEIGGRLFVNLAGIGLDACMASQFNDAKNLHRGFSGYLRLASRLLLTYSPQRYVIDAENTHRDVRAVVVVVANSAQYGNGARIAPGARVDDGELDLVVVEESSRFVTICQTPRLFTGSLGGIPQYSTRRVRDVTIQSREPMIFHVDGEPFEGGIELTARVRSDALRICTK